MPIILLSGAVAQATTLLFLDAEEVADRATAVVSTTIVAVEPWYDDEHGLVRTDLVLGATELLAGADTWAVPPDRLTFTGGTWGSRSTHSRLAFTDQGTWRFLRRGRRNRGPAPPSARQGASAPRSRHAAAVPSYPAG